MFVPDHQLIYCTRKINKTKTGGVQKHITFCLFEKYTVDAHKDALTKVNFQNYKLFNDINKAYSNFKKAKDNTLKLITVKKLAFFDDKLSECIGKPKELWETLKFLGMPKKTLISNFNAIESNNALTFDKKTIAKFIKDFFSNLAESLLIKLSLILQTSII